MATLPALASLDDFAARLGYTPTEPPEVARVLAAIDDASAIVRRVTHRSFTTDDGQLDVVPDEVKSITLRLAITAFTNPDGIRQESIGGYSYTYAGAGEGAAAGMYLTRFELKVLGAYRAGEVTTPLVVGSIGYSWEASGIINLPEVPD